MKKLDASYWTAEPLAPIPLLTALRTFVLERSHTRLPKWHFRMADDLVLRIQPKPAERRDRFFAFAGHAFEGAGITRAALDSATARAELWELDFGITAADDSDLPFALSWTLQPRRIRWPRTAVDVAARAAAFRRRVLAVFSGGSFDGLRADMMLSSACLCCGKALTDPVSIARWFGPECAGTASVFAPA